MAVKLVNILSDKIAEYECHAKHQDDVINRLMTMILVLVSVLVVLFYELVRATNTLNQIDQQTFTDNPTTFGNLTMSKILGSSFT
jgi:hypothetical protein